MNNYGILLDAAQQGGGGDGAQGVLYDIFCLFLRVFGMCFWECLCKDNVWFLFVLFVLF